eukprot:18042-Heterococcus_DN1.PRE.1
MARKKAQKKQQQRSTEQLSASDLHELLKGAHLAIPEHLASFLAGGGQPNATVQVRRFEEKAEVPLLHALTLNTHDQVVPCIELLLSAGAEVDKLCLDEDGDTCTALMWATNSLYGEPHMRALLAHGAKPSVQNSSGQTALHTAAS